MIQINQLTLPIGHTAEDIMSEAARLLHVPEHAVEEVRILRRSIDARRKDHILFSYIVDVFLKDGGKESAAVKAAKNVNIKLERERPYRYPEPGEQALRRRPVVIGAGPAGLFAGLTLAKCGYQPVILEQGDDVKTRAAKVESFWKTGDDALDELSNVQFGEGGAGTFSDGKLNTLVKDASGRNRAVLETFVELGADQEILWDSKPHIGTDVLRGVVTAIRRQIEEEGGQVRFRSKVTDFKIEGGAVRGVVVNGDETIETDHVILCVGHSARDMFSLLEQYQVEMEAKAFAVGLRIQHPQRQINLSQYGAEESRLLGPAPYKVTARAENGRSVYSFCMCPGGFVVNASSEKGRLSVNGMSNFKRDGENANSAIIVAVTPADFPGTGPLSGVQFQKNLERLAFERGNGKIPVQLYADFKENRESRAFGDVAPCFCGAYSFANLREVLPSALSQAFLQGMDHFGKRISGFDRPDAILSGVESRTSSPVRIVRDENLESSIRGLFPCGEGAGYAGGITSAAMDGMKVAEEIIRKHAPAFDR